MKIGIITTTFENYGTRLQNLATVLLLKKEHPHASIETIVISKFCSKYKLISRILSTSFFSNIYLRIKFRGKINKNNKLLHYRVFFLKSDKIEEYKIIKKRYDLIVVGSDQVWKFYSYMPIFKFALFSKNKICNAPSLPSRIISDETFANVAPLVLTFSDINFREQTTVDYFNKRGIKCGRLDDPTLRLPKEEWIKYVKKNVEHYDYFVYILNDNKCYDEVIATIDKDASVKSLFLLNNGCDKFKYTPIQFVSFLKNSDCIITNSFHGACFAKIFGKKLKIVNNKLNDEKDSRFDIFLSYENLVE